MSEGGCDYVRDEMFKMVEYVAHEFDMRQCELLGIMYWTLQEITKSMIEGESDNGEV